MTFLEKHLIRMPEDENLFVAACAAIQSQHAQIIARHKGKLWIDTDVIFKTDSLEELLPLTAARRVPESILYRDQYSMVFDLSDVSRVLSLCVVSNQHAAEACASILGVNLLCELPDVSPLRKDVEAPDVLFLNINHGKNQLVEWLENNRPELTYEVYDGRPLNVLYKAMNVKMLVSPMNSVTYMAAANGVLLAEIYPAHLGTVRFSKASSGRYYRIKEGSSAAAIWRAMELLWDRAKCLCGRDSEIPMGLSMSIVESVRIL